jgi:predicted nucleic acid-binding protein
MAERMVIDASVAAKWFLRDPLEADVDLAEELLIALLADDIEMHAPRIFTYEVCKLLTKACLSRDPRTKDSRLGKGAAEECVRRLFALPIEYAETTAEESLGAIDLAVSYAKQYYDMIYIRLARELDCHWCTADEKLLLGLAPGFPSNRVLLLSSLRD